MTHSDKAVQLFSQRYHCSQAVFAAFAEEMGLDQTTALKIGGCFGCGMNKGEVCGACTGALMTIGLKYGQGSVDDMAARAKSSNLCVRFLDEFAKNNGLYLCKELLGYDITQPDQLAAVKEAGLFTEFCPKMVESAAKILDEIIQSEEQL